MRKKKKKEEKESLGWALIPGPLPYQGNVQPFPLNEITKAVEVVGLEAPAQGLDWLGFQEYLSKTCGSKNTAKIRLLYAKKFYHVLVQNDAQDLLTIESVEKRMNVM